MVNFFNREERKEREGFWEDEKPLRTSGEVGSVSRGCA